MEETGQQEKQILSKLVRGAWINSHHISLVINAFLTFLSAISGEDTGTDGTLIQPEI